MLLLLSLLPEAEDDEDEAREGTEEDDEPEALSVGEDEDEGENEGEEEGCDDHKGELTGAEAACSNSNFADEVVSKVMSGTLSRRSTLALHMRLNTAIRDVSLGHSVAVSVRSRTSPETDDAEEEAVEAAGVKGFGGVKGAISKQRTGRETEGAETFEMGVHSNSDCQTEEDVRSNMARA